MVKNNCCCSVAQSCPADWDTMDCMGLSVLHHLREFAQLMAVESVLPSSRLILCCLLSFCPQSFPAPGSFPMSQLFTSGGQSIGASVSASVFPLSNIKYFFFFLSLFFRKRAILVLLTWAYCSSLNLWTCLLPNIYLLIWGNNFLENI